MLPSIWQMNFGKTRVDCLYRRTPEPRSEFFAKGTGDFRDGRLIVLVDEFSASASEIVTGAVQTGTEE